MLELLFWFYIVGGVFSLVSAYSNWGPPKIYYSRNKLTRYLEWLGIHILMFSISWVGWAISNFKNKS